MTIQDDRTPALPFTSRGIQRQRSPRGLLSAVRITAATRLPGTRIRSQSQRSWCGFCPDRSNAELHQELQSTVGHQVGHERHDLLVARAATNRVDEGLYVGALSPDGAWR